MCTLRCALFQPCLSIAISDQLDDATVQRQKSTLAFYFVLSNTDKITVAIIAGAMHNTVVLY